MNETFYKIVYNYERVPKILQKSMAKWFMKHRSKVVNIYHEHISKINSEYESLGKPVVDGNNEWGINAEYGRFVRSKMRPHLRSINKQFIIFQYDIDDIGDIIAYVKGIKNSKLYIELIESKK